MTTFLDTLRQDLEKLIEGDLPTVAEVRPLLGALVKRVEQLAGIEGTTAPERVAEPAQPDQPEHTAAAAPASIAVGNELPPARPETVVEPAAPAPAVEDQRQVEIDRLKAQLAELEGNKP